MYKRQLYSPEGQDIIGRNFYRPRDPVAKAKYAHQFPDVKTVTVEDAFGGWEKAQPKFFGFGGIFDQAYGQTGQDFFAPH